MRSIARRLRPRLSFANAVSAAALMIALGGTSYAIGLGKNSVGAREIERNAVRAAEVKNRTLGQRELRFEAVAEHELDILGDSVSATNRGSGRQAVEADDPVLLPPDGSLATLAVLSVQQDLSQPVASSTSFHVTAYAQAVTQGCNGPVSVVTRIAVDDQDAPDDQNAPVVPDMRADLNDTVGIAAAPIAIGGVFVAPQTTGFAPPERIELLARAEYGPGANPGCILMADRSLIAIRLSE